jgi:YD repeat-containing protein
VSRRAGAVDVRSEYDPAGHLVHQSGRRGPQRPAVLDRRYRYDPHGQLLALEDLARGTKRFRYDAAERLVGVDGATPEAFVSDPAGNVLPLGAGGAEGDAAGDRLRMWGDRRFDYDAEGRRTREWFGAGNETERRYTYNGAGLLAQVEEVSRRGIRHTRYGYDALGRRAWKEAEVSPPQAANAPD